MTVLILFALPCVAQDASKQLEQASKLEAQAEKLLDQGKRAEAFDALARAAELREKARSVKPEGKKPDKKPGEKPVEKPVERVADAAEAAHGELDAALKAGNLDAARMASDKLRQARRAQAKRIAALEMRLRAMERQLEEIRSMLEIEKPG